MYDTISLKRLEVMEQVEYETYRELQAIADDARRKDGKISQSLRNNIEWQRGRWAMLAEIIEYMKGEQ